STENAGQKGSTMGREEYPVFEEQIPLAEEEQAFEGAEFVDNPEPRCPCVLLLDTSKSMSGKPIEELNAGLKLLRDELLEDELAAKRAEVAIVAFGPVRVENDFTTPEFFEAPELEAEGETPLGAAVERALELIDERKNTYRENGINYYRPWIFLITDGAPTDQWEKAAKKIQAGEKDGKFAFFPVGVQKANMEVLGKLSTRKPLKLDGLRFRD